MCNELYTLSAFLFLVWWQGLPLPSQIFASDFDPHRGGGVGSVVRQVDLFAFKGENCCVRMFLCLGLGGSHSGNSISVLEQSFLVV